MVDEKKKPEMKSRKGRFQISIWKREKVIAPKEEDTGFVPERKVDVIRACIQYGRKVNGVWQNQHIWCNPEELRDLQGALNELQVDEGDNPSSCEDCGVSE